MFYSARYPKSDWTELSCLPWKYPRPTTKKTLSTVEAGCAALRLIYAASEGRFGIVAAAVKVSSEGQWKAEAAHVQKWALIHSRAHAAAHGGSSYRNRPQLKNARRRRGGLRRRVCLWVAAPAVASSGAYASSYFGCQVQWVLLFPSTNFTERAKWNTLKDNLILSLIRYVVAIKS